MTPSDRDTDPRAGAAASDRLTQLIEVNWRNEASMCVLQGADVNLRTSGGTTPLIWAAAMGDLGLVTQLLEAGARVNDSDDFGFTPLMAALGHGLVMQLLIDQGADVNQVDQYGWTPMRRTCLWGADPESVLVLLEAGARFDVEDWLALAEYNYSIRGERLAAKTCGLLLTRGVNVDWCSLQGTTALMSAAAASNVPVVEVLLAAGADPRLQDGNHRTAPQYARDRLVGRLTTREAHDVVRLIRCSLGRRSRAPRTRKPPDQGGSAPASGS